MHRCSISVLPTMPQLLQHITWKEIMAMEKRRTHMRRPGKARRKRLDEPKPYRSRRMQQRAMEIEHEWVLDMQASVTRRLDDLDAEREQFQTRLIEIREIDFAL